MHLVVNALPLLGLQTGIGRSLRNLYTTAEALDPWVSRLRIGYFDGFGMRYDLPRPADPKRWTAATDAVWKLPDPAVLGLRIFRQIQYEIHLRKLCRTKNFDVYHETSFFPAAQNHTPTVFSLFDFSLDRFAQTHPRERVWFHRLFFRRRLRYAAHIVAISQAVLQEAKERLALHEDRLSAVPLAPDPVFFPRPTETVKAVRQRFALDGPYVLFVGSLEPRKNLQLAWKALQRLKGPLTLVLVGWTAWGDKSWLAKAMARNGSKASRVVLTGFLDDETLAALYTGATAFVYPSLYEGFGLPVLEAMACGCPVVCSRIPALEEVSEGAAIFIDPHDPDAMASALHGLLENPAGRQEWIHRGWERVKAFTWEKTARAMLDIFQKVAERNPCRSLS